MDVSLPGHGLTWSLQWLVAEGDTVAAGQVLAWLERPGLCGSSPLSAPISGRLVARWEALAALGESGEIAAVIDGPPARCRSDEERALQREEARARERLELLMSSASGRHPSAVVLLAAERHEIECLLQSIAQLRLARRRSPSAPGE
jgi:hypothetical protein